MQATDRLMEIVEKFGAAVERILPAELDGSALRVILHLKDGSNLRVTEQWEGGRLRRYSYYWLTSDNELKIGWDNAPHHRQLETFPHHKHVQNQNNLQPSAETCLEEVMKIILQ
ncbi:transposase [Candidatus Magnetomoraceae bacterium gMMP-15]